MSSEISISIVLWLLGLAFAAGGAWVALKESQRHVNGVGSKLNRAEQDRQDRENRFGLAIFALAETKEQKQLVAQLLSKGEPS